MFLVSWSTRMVLLDTYVDMPIIPQVIVSETVPQAGVFVDGYILGEYAGWMPLDQKFDIEFDAGFIPGRWITIFDLYTDTTTLAQHSLTLAEVRVYGSKCE